MPQDTRPSWISRSTIQLLRFPFSFFLMPVYWFALSQLPTIDWYAAGLIFFILHGLVYPASNGYNSYMDRDESSIGGLKNPPMPTTQLFPVTVIMDLAAVLLGLFIGWIFSGGLLVYILASRAYSYRGIRLKKFLVTGYLTVTICQGALIFFLVYHGASPGQAGHVPPAGMLASSLLVGGFYPLTQIYQQEADRKDGIRTISILLGSRGSFLFSGIVYSLALLALAYQFFSSLEEREFFILATTMLPILVYFFVWAARVWRNEKAANFENTMKMNLLASCCTNSGFILVMLFQQL